MSHILFLTLSNVVTPNNSSDPPRLLNYLTAPHVLVWSAAVASSSLPGVFEANRLMVKDADGTVRYESAESARFSDGSMEQDLPMQQLSEMFNVNHFIISQANPHAVMFASYSQFKSVWSNPMTGLVNAVLTFLKDQCRSWLSHVVELVGARRFAPQHATSRGIGSQFFVQEYEGRDCDISLIPWIGHRGLISALMHALYNPSEAEFRSWVEAAQRETWKVIPAIKSHVAEEITLDRCVQRLRKRIVSESWQKRGVRMDSTNAKMGERVPSFFTSPSLVNFGGLAVGDQSHVEGLEVQYRSREDFSSNKDPHPPAMPSLPQVDFTVNQRLGLKGNRSGASLERSPSDGSGLFIDGDDNVVEQVAGERTNHTPPSSVIASKSGSTPVLGEGKGYVKTTNMAQFYYRNFPSSHGSFDKMPRSLSHGEQIKKGTNENRHLPSVTQHNRRKSQSHHDLGSAFAKPNDHDLGSAFTKPNEIPE